MVSERYSRLAAWEGFEPTLGRWQRLSCAVIGLGGLGSGLVQQLARIGVRQLVLIDRDIVGHENLGHQLLYSTADAEQGLPKAIAAQRVAQHANPDVEVIACPDELGRANVTELLSPADLLFDGLDSFFTRMVVNDFAIKSGKPLFYAGVVRGEMSVKAVIPGSGSCLRCLMPQLPAAGNVPTCSSEGVFPGLLGVANALQLDLANRFIAGQQLADELISLNTSDWVVRRIDTSALGSSCPACSNSEFEFLLGRIDHSASAECSSGRFSIQLPGDGISLEETAATLGGTGRFRVTANRYCLTAEADGVRYTLFPGGRLLGEGIAGEQELNRFATTYLGL